MKTNIFILLLPITILLSCKKENTIELNFRIYNHMANEFTGKAKVSVEIYKKHKKNKGTEFIWGGFTDQSGRVSFKATDLSTDNEEYFYVYDSKNNSVSGGSYIDIPMTHYLSRPTTFFLEKNKPNNINVTYASFLYHKVTFINDSCTGPNDSFRFRKKFMKVKEGWSQWSAYKYGCDNTGDGQQVHNDSLIYEFEVQRAGITNIYQIRTTTTGNGTIHF